MVGRLLSARLAKRSVFVPNIGHQLIHRKLMAPVIRCKRRLKRKNKIENVLLADFFQARSNRLLHFRLIAGLVFQVSLLRVDLTQIRLRNTALLHVILRHFFRIIAVCVVDHHHSFVQWHLWRRLAAQQQCARTQGERKKKKFSSPPISPPLGLSLLSRHRNPVFLRVPIHQPCHLMAGKVSRCRF